MSQATETPPSGVPLTQVSVPSPEIIGIARAWPFIPIINTIAARALLINVMPFPLFCYFFNVSRVNKYTLIYMTQNTYHKYNALFLNMFPNTAHL
jgi:hypothetical protein